MERNFTRDAVSGRKALFKGWVVRTRDMGNLKFFLLRDREGSIQVTLKKSEAKPDVLDAFKKLKREDCVSVLGTPKKTKLAEMGIEIVPENIEILSSAKTPLPLETSEHIISEKETRFDYRFIDMRNPKVQAIFRIRDVILTKLKNYFESEKFIEVHTPVIQYAGAEGGATLFSMKYYNKTAYLRQSPQLYKQILMASGMDRVYEIGPAFRAEKFHTTRHVSEFLSVDMEMAWIESVEDVLNLTEKMIAEVYRGVKKECKNPMEILGLNLKIPETPFKRISYEQCMKILEKKQPIKWGQDLEDAQEKIIGDHLAKAGNEWFFITRYPQKIKPFYIMADGEESHAFDLNHMGTEIASGGQREHRYDFLVKRMREKGLKPDDFRFYLDAFQYGIPPHGGFGLGGDRLVKQITGSENVKEAIIFPRTPERLVP